jgi:membrane associated rhomboid family serine protease
MFPIGDDNSARKIFPIVTYALIALNVLFFFVALFLHENVQTEAVSIQFEHFDANRGHSHSDFGP